MKRILLYFFLLLPFITDAQFGNRNALFSKVAVPVPGGNTPFSFAELPYSATDSINPGRGAEQWHNGSQAISYPTDTYNVPSWDVYYRWIWADLEGTTLGSYGWVTNPSNNLFDNIMRAAINSGQQLSFGIMTVYNGSGQTFSGGGRGAYPTYLHNAMQAESPSDWQASDGTWIPNFNSSTYIARLTALYTSLNNHILATSYTAVSGPRSGQSVRYQDAIFAIDIRGFGSYGEWHTNTFAGGCCNPPYPASVLPTASALIQIIDAHKVFADWPLVPMIATFSGNNNIDVIPVPSSVACHTLNPITGRNTWGRFGWRRDQWGSSESYLTNILANNSTNCSGTTIGSQVVTTYTVGPITGEPPSFVPPEDAGNPYGQLENQVILYHATSIGNGNYGYNMGANPPVRANVRAAFKRTGFRIRITTGEAPQSINRTVAFSIKCNWVNVGVAPAYNNWVVQFELQTGGGTTVWTGTSSKILKLFLPESGVVETTDVLTVPGSVSAGTYRLVVRVRDGANNYRPNMKLAIIPRNGDGTYTIFNNVVVN